MGDSHGFSISASDPNGRAADCASAEKELSRVFKKHYFKGTLFVYLVVFIFLKSEKNVVVLTNGYIITIIMLMSSLAYSHTLWSDLITSNFLNSFFGFSRVKLSISNAYVIIIDMSVVGQQRIYCWLGNYKIFWGFALFCFVYFFQKKKKIKPIYINTWPKQKSPFISLLWPVVFAITT